MRQSECRTDILIQISQTPFADRLELAALTRWSPSAVYRQMARLEQCGLIEPVTHTTPLIPTTRRFCLIARSVQVLPQETGSSISQLLRSTPVSEQWRRLILQRLDTAAILYRLTTTISEIAYPLQFQWFRAQPMDAMIELPDGRSVVIVRIGCTTDRTAMSKRLRRLDETLGVGAALIILPDELRLRHARRMLDGATLMSFLAVERDVLNAMADSQVWRVATASSRFSLRESLGYALPLRDRVIERPLSRVSLPGPLADVDAKSLSAAEQRALDLIGDWPWLRIDHLADLLNCGQRRSRQVLSALTRHKLVVSHRADGKSRLALSDNGIVHIARRDRAAVGTAKQRWSVEPQDSDRPFGWRNIVGTRSRQLLRHLKHTEAVHQFISQVAKQASERGHQFTQLDPPHRASRYFRYKGAVRSIHPDAYFELRIPNNREAFFLEYERRADRPSTMRDRLAPYLRYYSTRRPLEDHGLIPSVLVVFEDELSADHFLAFARAELSRRRVEVPLFVSSQDQVDGTGPLAQVWRTIRSQELSRPLYSLRRLRPALDHDSGCHL